MIGNVETLEPSQPATVSTNIDEEQNIVYFNFGIPQGVKGDTGDINLVNFEVENGVLKAYDEEGHIYYLGTVAMEPKGEYSATTSYEKLNTVLYNDSTYMALKPSLGNPPTDTEYWQLIGGGLTREDIVDNLNSNDATKMLSAKQGKVIDSKLEGKISYFNTIATMKAGDLKAGNLVETKGYYTSGDGGGAKYEIVDDETLTEDGAYIHELSNGLFARMIIENDTINFRQLGAKPDDSTFDNKNYLLKYQTICNNLGKQIKLIIPNGEWYFSPTHLVRVGGFNIEGIGSSSDRSFSAPKIKAINNQNYIWKFGGEENMDSSQLPFANTNTGNNIKNLVFASGEYTINYGALVLEYANYGFYDNIFFTDLRGTGLYIRSSWENYYGMLSFRGIKDFTKPCLLLAEARSISGVSANISSSSFDKLIFELISGDLIKSEIGSNFVNNQFNEINVEYSYASSATTTRITDSTDLSGMTPLYLFNGNMSGVTIDTINMTGLNSYHSYITENEVNYYFKSLFNTIGGGTTESHRYDVNIGKISARSMVQILTAHNPYDGAMIFNLGDYVETSNDTQNAVFDKFDLINAGYVHYNSILTRRNRINNIPYNTVKLYQNDSAGYLTTDSNAIGDKICLQRGGGAITRMGFRYPYDYDSNDVKTKWLLRIKTDSDGAYGFVLRGYHEGNNVNKTYSQSGLTANTWYNVEIEMNYDFNSIVNLVNLTAACLVDTLTQI